jgi:glutathione synthase/RimK-type ligase-like ATP-grasp enzyme
MSFFIYPYNSASASVKVLKQGLQAKVIRLKNSRYRNRFDHTIINYGNSRRPESLRGVPMINEPEQVAIASNKLSAFNALQEARVATVPFTNSREMAEEWLALGFKVFVRSVLNGHSGEGIQVIEPSSNSELSDIANRLREIGNDELAEIVDEYTEESVPDLPDAPLYTLGIENHGEYRVHVVNDEVILYQKKSRRVDEEGEVDEPDDIEATVRNLSTGWVYRTSNLRRLDRVEELARQAIDALQLDFGAVDIIMNEDGEVFVLEVNTAPGLGNTETREAYIEALSNFN